MDSCNEFSHIPIGFSCDCAQDMPHALYLHIPFCAKRCSYCDFATWVAAQDDVIIATYVKSLVRSLHQLASGGLLSAIQTVYIGGGTPSLLGEKLVELVQEICYVCNPLELSCEANPESFSQKFAQNLASAGATRVSLGVQSLLDQELKALGRIHTAQTARTAIGYAKQAGLDVSADLMCGIPLQTLQSWEYSVKQLIASEVDHISIYPLMIEEDTLFWKQCQDGLLAWPDDDAQASMMHYAQQALQERGYSRYEVASYARIHKQCQHNLAYWSGVPYIALGTSGSAMLSRQAYEKFCELVPHMPLLDKTISRVRYTITSTRKQVAAAKSLAAMAYELEFLDEQQASAEDLMLAVRTSYGITPALYERSAKALGVQKLDRALAHAYELGLLQQLPQNQAAKQWWIPTQRGWLLGNKLYGILWGLAQRPVESVQIEA
ncbi:radical SAM family heme chaperone HemW [Atopobium fossor]|uniref:radical SAM family heme chaperone HemW n=1 Tax=Atopobium fossor TaxID=39487 RepID=UPI000409C333|nr:radical SAM family heme chaperone HemW [Atopobium fossor]